MKWIRRIGISLSVVLVVLLIGVYFFLHNMNFAESEEAIAKAFQGIPYELQTDVVQFDGQPIQYAEIGHPEKPVVLFVHGSPGMWDNFLMEMSSPELLDYARVISVTRPGYGASGSGVYEPSLEKQAAAMLHVLKLRSPDKPAVLVGHSFGGPVIARMAMDAPAQVAGLVLAAASIDPVLEETLWFQIPASVPPLTWLLPDDLLVCNLEILALKDELEKMLPLWKDIQVPVTVIHGDQDNLVPVANAEFAERMLVNAPVLMKRFPSMNHFVIWTHPKLVVDSIIELLEHEPG
ncbi:MAG: alpha/beta fold hydrolase [Rhodothermales bacterium]